MIIEASFIVDLPGLCLWDHEVESPPPQTDVLRHLSSRADIVFVKCCQKNRSHAHFSFAVSGISLMVIDERNGPVLGLDTISVESLFNITPLAIHRGFDQPGDLESAFSVTIAQTPILHASALRPKEPR